MENAGWANLRPKPFQKGTVNNPNGRPQKFTSQLVKAGYKLSEVNQCIAAMLALTTSELEDIEHNPQATILETTIAGALLKGNRKQDLSAIETLLNRKFGKPKETHEITVSPELIAARNMFFALVHQERIEQEKALQIVIDAANKNGFMLNPADITSTDVKGI